MKKIVLASLLLAVAGAAQAQQQPQFTHYGLNGMYLNPAYAGVKQQVEVNVIGRYQYLNLGNSTPTDDNGSPRTGMVSASIPILPISGGVGIAAYYDQAGATKLSNVALSYSQHIRLGKGRLGIGIQGTYTRIGKGTYRAIDPDDVNIPANSSDGKFDAGAGLWYESPKFYAGLSTNNLFRAKYQFTGAGAKGIGSQYLGENHAYLTMGYNIEASSSVVITPMVLAKAVLPGDYDTKSKYDNQHNYSFEGGVRATFNDQFSVGANYRYDESISGLVGYAFGADNRYRIGYAFDFIAFNQDARAFSSHEILLQLRLPKMLPLIRPAIHTPRYSF